MTNPTLIKHSHETISHRSLCLVRVACSLIAACSIAGCSGLGVTSWLKGPKFNEAGPRNPVIDVVCLWEPSEGRGTDNLPCRGFAGQLLFLTVGSKEPAKVSGDLRVYVFDDQGTMEEQSKPIRQFDFKKEAFAIYLVETNFGPAYQLFIPYTRSGAHEAHCALRVRFTPADGGPPIYSKMADITLPGAKTKMSAARWQPEHHQVRSAAAELMDGSSAAEQKRPTGGLHAAAPDLRETEPFSLGATYKAAQAEKTRSRLQQLSARLAESETGNVVEPAAYEVEAPSTGRRFQLHTIPE